MATRDLRSYFTSLSKDKKASHGSCTSIPQLVKTTGNVTAADASAVNAELESFSKKKERQGSSYNTNIPSRIKEEVGKYAHTYGTQAAIKHFKSKYPHYTFLRTTINNWKRKFNKKEGVPSESPTFRKTGRPNIVRDELVQKIKNVIVGVRLSGALISRRMVISIGNGVLKVNEPNTLSEFGGIITLTEDWARGILRSMDWVKRKATTGKVEPFTQFLAEEKFTFQKAISTYVYDHDIPTDLIINLDQTPLSNVSPGKYTFNMKGVKHVPIKGVDDKRQITTTFAVSASGDFLPMQLIYAGETKRCLPKFTFSRSFHVTYTKNHWSNQVKVTEHFEKVIFPFLDQIKERMGYPKEQMSLVIMDTFKGQDNDELRKLCMGNNCEVVIVPHNLTNKFQPLDLSVNKAAKAFISEKCNTWMTNGISKQINRGIQPPDVKVSLNLSVIKPLHAKWIVDLHHYLKAEKPRILCGFRAAGISEAIENAKSITEKVGNPFKEL